MPQPLDLPAGSRNGTVDQGLDVRLRDDGLGFTSDEVSAMTRAPASFSTWRNTFLRPTLMSSTPAPLWWGVSAFLAASTSSIVVLPGVLRRPVACTRRSDLSSLTWVVLAV